MEKIYDKLVRDKIPDICKSNGDIPTYRILSDDEYRKCLELKFYEEVNEVILGSSEEKLEELGDLLEVMLSYGALYGLTLDDIVISQETKREKRGGFSRKILLIKTERKND